MNVVPVELLVSRPGAWSIDDVTGTSSKVAAAIILGCLAKMAGVYSLQSVFA